MKKAAGSKGQFIPVLFAALSLLAMGTLLVSRTRAQGGDMQQRMTELKLSMAQNKQKLSQYTWQEFITISLKGEQKKQETFLVRLGPDGKPVKTPVDQPSSDSSDSGGGRRGGRLKQRVVEKKKEEYKDYADRMKALMEQYVPPDKDLIEKAVMDKKVDLVAVPGAPSQMQIIFHDYYKPKDSLTLTFDKEKKQIVSIDVASWLDDPTDAVNLTVRMSRLPDGTSHVDSAVLDGVSKQMKVVTQNSNYQHI